MVYSNLRVQQIDTADSAIPSLLFGNFGRLTEKVVRNCRTVQKFLPK